MAMVKVSPSSQDKEIYYEATIKEQFKAQVDSIVNSV